MVATTRASHTVQDGSYSVQSGASGAEISRTIRAPGDYETRSPLRALTLWSDGPAVAEPAFPTAAWAGREDPPCSQYVHRGLDQLRLLLEVSRDALCAMGMALVIPKPLPHFALDHVIGHSGILAGRLPAPSPADQWRARRRDTVGPYPGSSSGGVEVTRPACCARTPTPRSSGYERGTCRAPACRRRGRTESQTRARPSSRASHRPRMGLRHLDRPRSDQVPASAASRP